MECNYNMVQGLARVENDAQRAQAIACTSLYSCRYGSENGASSSNAVSSWTDFEAKADLREMAVGGR